MAKAPAFQFYANNWLSSTKIALMTPAQEGAYIRLLAYAWDDPNCSLPDDDDRLSVLSRLGEGWFNGGAQVLRECFEPHPNLSGRLVNLRLLEERKKQEEWREKSRMGGIKSAESRNKKRIKGGSRVVEPKGNSSSSSSSSIEEKKTAPSTSSMSRGTSPRSRASLLPDEEWLKELQAKPAYKDLDVALIFSKADSWCQVKGKQLTRARFINWLNREDRPLAVAANGNGSAGHGETGFSSRFCPACKGARQRPRIVDGQISGFDTCGECNGTGKPTRQAVTR